MSYTQRTTPSQFGPRHCGQPLDWAGFVMQMRQAILTRGLLVTRVHTTYTSIPKNNATEHHCLYAAADFSRISGANLAAGVHLLHSDPESAVTTCSQRSQSGTNFKEAVVSSSSSDGPTQSRRTTTTDRSTSSLHAATA